MLDVDLRLLPYYFHVLNIMIRYLCTFPSLRRHDLVILLSDFALQFVDFVLEISNLLVELALVVLHDSLYGNVRFNLLLELLDHQIFLLSFFVHIVDFCLQRNSLVFVFRTLFFPGLELILKQLIHLLEVFYFLLQLLYVPSLG